MWRSSSLKTSKCLMKVAGVKDSCHAQQGAQDLPIPPPLPGYSSDRRLLEEAQEGYAERRYKTIRSNPSDPSCPLATQDLEVNTKNRDAAIAAEHIKYGPLNLNDEAYWVRYAEKWGTTPRSPRNPTAVTASPSTSPPHEGLHARKDLRR